jgi:hypothetical protein
MQLYDIHLYRIKDLQFPTPNTCVTGFGLGTLTERDYLGIVNEYGRTLQQILKQDGDV